MVFRRMDVGVKIANVAGVNKEKLEDIKTPLVCYKRWIPIWELLLSPPRMRTPRLLESKPKEIYSKYEEMVCVGCM